MSDFFDIYTLIYLVIAVVILMRLRSVLGRRTGHERRPFDPYSESGGLNGSATSDKNDEKVVPLPRRGSASRRTGTREHNWGEFAEQGSAQAKAFDSFLEVDPHFDPRGFVDGASAAYEMIVNGYASGDRKTLKPLLSDEVYAGFEDAIEDREKRGETVESKFVSIDKADIEKAVLKKPVAHITVRFLSKLVSATRDKSGKVIDGDPSKVRSMTDVWTFARDLTSSNPNWKVVATEAAD